MIANRKPELIFEGGFDEREAIECRDRGYRSHVSVRLENGERFPVMFYDPIRLRQELDDEVRDGRPFIAEPGLIVVPEVTLENMEKAACSLAKFGYFDSLRPIGSDSTPQVAH